ncbi:hypothetical protein [Phenylobacterium sp.]|uniref:hypothetical protein n=1 Tax=Phenylobacterium sp. TaxID=1871053 RepID=UPI003002F954
MTRLLIGAGVMSALAAAASLAAASQGSGLSHRELEEIRRAKRRRENPAPEPAVETRQMRRARERREAKAKGSSA